MLELPKLLIYSMEALYNEQQSTRGNDKPNFYSPLEYHKVKGEMILKQYGFSKGHAKDAFFIATISNKLLLIGFFTKLYSTCDVLFIRYTSDRQ